MKLFKKLLALTLVLCMVFCLSVAVLAADGDGTEGKDDSSTTPSVELKKGEYDETQAIIKKVYKLENANTTSPEDTFTVEFVKNSDGTTKKQVISGEATEAPDLLAITAASYQAGDATREGFVKEIKINLPTYTAVGEYAYWVKETVGNTAGVVYHTNEIKLVVSVVHDVNNKNDGDDFRVVAVHAEEESGDKTDRIENKYQASSLSINKQVTGNFGDQTGNKKFNFTVTFTEPEGKNAKSVIGKQGDNTFELNFAAPSDDSNGAKVATTTFQLAHNETVTFTNIPYGVTYTVTEEEASGYTATNTVNGTTSVNGKVATGTIAASNAVVFTNNSQKAPDMGVSLDSLPYILALAVAFGGAVVMITRKRHVED